MMDLFCCGSVDDADRGGPKVAKYKLRYFDIRGLGEPIRLMFCYAGVPFEDVRIPQHEWADIKPTTRFGKLPELEVDGKVLAQSMTIARYLAEEFGLAGKDEWEKAKIDELGDLQKDLSHELAIYVGTALGMRDGDRAALRKEIYLPTIARILPVFVGELRESGTGFLTSSGPTWIDFFVEEYLLTLHNIEKKLFKRYPELEAFVNKVQSIPQLFSYMSTRNQTIV